MVISVDLDYFFPYNNSIYDYAIEDNFYNQSINMVDYDKLKQIKHLIKNKKVILLETHNQLLQFINKGNIVVNFDFHHDISYYKDDLQQFLIFKYLDDSYKESVWAGYAIKYLNIDYYWIGDKMSYIDNNINKFKYKINLTFNLDSDTIYLIRSKNYINEQQFQFIWRYLFD